MVWVDRVKDVAIGAHHVERTGPVQAKRPLCPVRVGTADDGRRGTSGSSVGNRSEVARREVGASPGFRPSAEGTGSEALASASTWIRHPFPRRLRSTSSRAQLECQS